MIAGLLVAIAIWPLTFRADGRLTTRKVWERDYPSLLSDLTQSTRQNNSLKHLDSTIQEGSPWILNPWLQSIILELIFSVLLEL